MTQRAYTVDEIDQMRSSMRMAGYEPDVAEDRLRTYMIGGIDPASLIAKMSAQIDANMEQSRKLAEANGGQWSGGIRNNI